MCGIAIEKLERSVCDVELQIKTCQCGVQIEEIERLVCGVIITGLSSL